MVSVSNRSKTLGSLGVQGVLEGQVVQSVLGYQGLRGILSDQGILMGRVVLVFLVPLGVLVVREQQVFRVVLGVQLVQGLLSNRDNQWLLGDRYSQLHRVVQQVQGLLLYVEHVVVVVVVGEDNRDSTSLKL